MHALHLSTAMQSALADIDCWAPSCADIQRIASLIIGDFPVPLLRHGRMKAIAAGRSFGSAADALPDEFAALGEQCAAILGSTPESTVRAAAFFYLRLQKIHPLTDCNGRLGRLLLCEQLLRAHGLHPDITLARLQARDADYRAAFAATTERAQYQLMCGLLSAVVGIDTAPACGLLSAPLTEPEPPLEPPFALAALHPERELPRLFNLAKRAASSATAPPARFARRTLAAALKSRRKPD
jgi:hypothetical protein